jgi:predicted DNA-binding antitoxin AbrB/MazE fold protein
MPGTVEKIIRPVHPSEPEKAQIAIEGADNLYRELRIENALTDAHGEKVRLKEGAGVELKVSAEPEDVAPPASTSSRSA